MTGPTEVWWSSGLPTMIASDLSLSPRSEGLAGRCNGTLHRLAVGRNQPRHQEVAVERAIDLIGTTAHIMAPRRNIGPGLIESRFAESRERGIEPIVQGHEICGDVGRSDAR